VNDVDLKNLINSAVDAELDGHRVAPPLDWAEFADRPGAARTVRLWSVPLLAASVAVLLAVGAMLVITQNREQHSNQVGNSASPTLSPLPSVSKSTDPDQEAAARAYEDAVASAREATEVTGVSVGPVSARDAARLKNTGLMSGDISGIKTPTPGRTYSFTLSYVAGPSEESTVAVLTTDVQDVASGSCAGPFFVRPAHTYLIHCQAMLLAGVTGKGTLTLRTPTGTTAGSMNLTDPAKYPASPSSSPDPQSSAARAYAEAVASAPEASGVAGVTDRPATVEERQRPAETVGMVNALITAPERGRSYPITLIYIPSANGPAVSVLTITFEDVAAARCSRPFRVRPAHAYQISCHVTFRPGAEGLAKYLLRGPKGVDTSGHNVSMP
jgi:hypothetical protein